MPTFLQYLNARRVSAVSPDCEIRMHTSSLKERRFLNLRHPSPKAKANLTKVTMATNKNVEIRISPKDGRATVKEVRGKINHHRKLCELLKNLPATKKTSLAVNFCAKSTWWRCLSGRRYRSRSAKDVDTSGFLERRT